MIQDEITLNDLKKMPEESYVLVDMRGSVAFSHGHIPHAVSIPMDHLEEQVWKNENVIIYCSIGEQSREIIRLLREKGVNACSLKGGFREWLMEEEKFLGGHNDTLAGFLVTSSEEIAEKLRFIIKTEGSGLAPFDSWLILRGIKTLPLRMEKAQENAQKIVDYLLSSDKVEKVYYPGIPGTRDYEICKKQASGFGSMITFEAVSKELALHILKSLKLIHFAESLGGVETLITYPTTQTHADVPEETRLRNGITDRVLRISAGIEDIRDLITDLDQAFQSFEG